MPAVLARTHPLDDGSRVRLRLARPGDADAVAALLERLGVAAGQLEIRRLLAHDPARRAVLTAFAPIDGTETLVGVAAIDLARGADVDTLVADERCARGLSRLLADVLRERAESHARRVA